MDIEELRKEIDGIDKELVSLFVKRMDVAAEVAAFKKENGRPVLDPERERKLLEKVSDLAGKDMESQTRILYHLILSLSRSHQSHLLGLDSTLTDKITKAIDTTDKVFPERAIVACQGVEGAYSQFACEKLFGAPSIMYMNTFEGVFQAVDKGLCRYGILPLENSTAGSVNQIYDLMRRYQFHIVRSTRVHVPHVLLAKKGVRFEDVREIYSHEQAIQQCSAFLQKHRNGGKGRGGKRPHRRSGDLVGFVCCAVRLGRARNRCFKRGEQLHPFYLHFQKFRGVSGRSPYQFDADVAA